MNTTQRLCIGLLGAPVAWVVQMSLSEPLAANACYPHQMLLPTPKWEGLIVMLTVISLTCLATGFLSGVVAWSSWRHAQQTQSLRFLTLLGVMSSFIFIIALLLTTCASLLVSPCHPWF